MDADGLSSSQVAFSAVAGQLGAWGGDRASFLSVSSCSLSPSPSSQRPLLHLCALTPSSKKALCTQAFLRACSAGSQTRASSRWPVTHSAPGPASRVGCSSKWPTVCFAQQGSARRLSWEVPLGSWLALPFQPCEAITLNRAASLLFSATRCLTATSDVPSSSLAGEMA